MADADIAANKEVVRRFFETFSSGDVPAILDSMADDGGWWVSGRLEGMSGRYDKASFGPLLAGAARIYKDGRVRIELRSLGSRITRWSLVGAKFDRGRSRGDRFEFRYSRFPQRHPCRRHSPSGSSRTAGAGEPRRLNAGPLGSVCFARGASYSSVAAKGPRLNSQWSFYGNLQPERSLCARNRTLRWIWAAA